MKPKHQRAVFIVVCLAIMGSALAAVLHNFRDNLVFFVTPTELAAKYAGGEIPSDQSLRLGGLVKSGSITQKGPNHIRFILTDMTTETAVDYAGFIPALFRDGQGAVADGHVQADGTFIATSLLAKHDENYMPPEVAKALKKSGHWQHDGNYPPAAESTAQ